MIMNRAMLMSKFISTKTTTPLRLNCGRIILEFAELILPCMVSGKFSVLEHILKLHAVKFRGFPVNHGSLKEIGNCPMDFSRK